MEREMVFLVLQYLDDEKYRETARLLEKESGIFFNMRYFEDIVTNGEWDEVEKYLSGFTKVDDNRYSLKIFYEIRKHKYLEALDKHDYSKAVEILRKEVKVFSTYGEELLKEITMLLPLENFREHENLSNYVDAKSARATVLATLKKLITLNPLFRDKLQFPRLNNSRLRTLINRGLNWQHQLCMSRRPNPDINTLFVDHTCGPPIAAPAPSHRTIHPIGLSPSPSLRGMPPLGAHGPFQSAPAPAPLTTSSPAWMAKPYSVPHQTVSAGPLDLNAPNNKGSENVLKRSDEINNQLPIKYPGQSHAHTSDDLPKTVVMNLNQGSAVKSMDFHPLQNILLLVGTAIGDITIWDLGSRERLVYRNFKVWNFDACLRTSQASHADEYAASVNRVIWSPDGALLGVAYSRHLVHLYSYYGDDNLQNHLQIDAHVGNVSDLAFSQPNKHLCIVTCGEDKTIKVWDAITGNKQYTFEGHESPVYSVCIGVNEGIQFLYSTSIDGKLKTWLYDNMGSRVDYDLPGKSCATLAYSTDGARLFSSGTSKEGESYIVEWNETKGTVKRNYHGLGKSSAGVVQFDTTKNRYLAAGDDFRIKYWEMDNANLLTTTDAEGQLPASPCIRFNKEGMLLAVSTSEKGIKILANANGVQLLHSIEKCAIDASRVASGTAMKEPIIRPVGSSSSITRTSIEVADRNAPPTTMVGVNGDSQTLPGVKPRVAKDSEKSKIWKLTEFNEPSQLYSLCLPDSLLPRRIVQLTYTNSGSAILALADNAVHKLWRWQKNDQNLSGKATSSVSPLFWQPSSGRLITNDILSETNQEDAVPCLALSKDDSFAVSASGGKISLFLILMFKTMATFMPPPPAATFLVFHPLDNNIIAIGMEDSSILIYNVKFGKILSKLEGHQKRVTGLAFSNALNVLVSSGADAQLCVWSMGEWEKQASNFLKIPSGRAPTPLAHTRVQFHLDQLHMLAVHNTHIAIYEATKLESLKQWAPLKSRGSITDAVYSCDGQSIFAGLEDGTVGVFYATTLQQRCRINPTAYLPSNPSLKVYPVVVAAHPSEPNQFALGLTDGAVYVLEPPESKKNWGTPPPQEHGAESSVHSIEESDQE